MFMWCMDIILFIPGSVISLFHFHPLKFFKCRQGFFFYRIAISKSFGLRFIIPFKNLKAVSSELCIHGSF